MIRHLTKLVVCICLLLGFIQFFAIGRVVREHLKCSGVSFSANQVSLNAQGEIVAHDAAFELVGSFAESHTDEYLILSAPKIRMAVDASQLPYRRLVANRVVAERATVYATPPSQLSDDNLEIERCQSEWIPPEENPFETEKKWRLIQPQLKSFHEISDFHSRVVDTVQQASFESSSLLEETNRLLNEQPQPENPLRNLDQLRINVSSNKELATKVSQLQNEIRQVKEAFESQIAEMQQVKNEDRERLSATPPVDQVASRAKAEELLSHFAIHRLRALRQFAIGPMFIRSLVGDHQPVMRESNDTQFSLVDTVASFGERGVDYRFGLGAQPDYALKSVAISGELENHESPVAFRAVGRHLTNDTSASGLPIQLDILFQMRDSELLAKTRQLQSAQTTLANVELEQRFVRPVPVQIVNQSGAAIQFESRAETVRCDLVYSVEQTTLKMKIQLRDLQLTLLPQVGRKMAERELTTSLSGTLNLEAELSPGRSITITKLQSDMTDAIAVGFSGLPTESRDVQVAISRKLEHDFSQQIEKAAGHFQRGIEDIESQLAQMNERLNESRAELVANLQKSGGNLRLSRLPADQPTIR